MSKELLKNVSEVFANGAEKEAIDSSRDKVNQTLCPDWVCEKRPEVKYGTREAITYYSNTTKCERRANVLLPADYSSDKKYPVLFFLHGIFGDENSMLYEEANKLDIINGNLVNEQAIEEAVIVFPNMYASDDPELQPGFNENQIWPYDNFINDLADDLIPFIEQKYSVLSDREHRAVIGFSMGGRETLYIGLMRSDLFDSFAAIAPAPGLVPSKDAMMEHKGQYEDETKMTLQHQDEKPDMIMICCGTNDGVVGQFPKSYDRILTDNNVDHIWYEVPGADHESTAIRSGFYNFLIRWNGIRK